MSNELCSKCDKQIDHNYKNRSWCKKCKNEYDKQYMREYRNKKNPDRKRRSPRGQQTPLCSRCKKVKENIVRPYCLDCQRLKSKEHEKKRARPYEGKYAETSRKGSREWRRRNKDLVNKKVKEDRKINPEKYLNYERNWRKNNLMKDRYNDVLTRHKITSEEYEKIIKNCNNLCEICEKQETKKSRTKGEVCKLSLDHCHDCEDNGYKGIETIRGALCHHCNAGIGHFKNNELLLLKAAEFIKKHICIEDDPKIMA